MSRSLYRGKPALQTRRDVLLLRFSSKETLVVSCDSSGGVGPKKRDTIRVDAEKVGRHAARTAILELRCVGSSLMALVLTLSTELEPTGMGIRLGIIEVLRELGIPKTIPIIGSSEKNFKVDVTGIGITALGLARTNGLRIGVSQPGDAVLLLGKPTVGEDVLESEKLRSIPTINEIELLLKSKTVHEILPVGSRGVLYETSVLAGDSGLTFEPSSSHNRKKLMVSAGPSTAVLVTTSFENKGRFIKEAQVPMTEIGHLRKRGCT